MKKRQNSVTAIGPGVWPLQRDLWVIQVQPTPNEATLMQAEMEGGVSYVLVFTSDEKAKVAISQLAVQNAWSAQVPSGEAMQLISAVCQIGARGVIVDLDPGTKRCAWSRQLLAAA